MGSVPTARQQRAKAADGPQTFRSATAAGIWWVWLLFATANWVDLAVQGRDRESVVAAAILLLATGVAYVTAQRPRIIADDNGVTIRNPLRDHHVGWARVTEVDLADLLRVHCDNGEGPPEQIAPDATKKAKRGKKDKQAKVISAWAVHYSRRRQYTAEARSRRAAARGNSGLPSLGLPSAGRSRNYGFGGGGSGSGRSSGAGYGSAQAVSPEAEAEKIVRKLSEYATAAKVDTLWAADSVEIAGPGQAAPGQAGPDQADTGQADTDQAGNGQPVVQAELAGPGDARLAGWYEPLTSSWNRVAIAALIVPALILLIVALI